MFTIVRNERVSVNRYSPFEWVSASFVSEGITVEFSTKYDTKTIFVPARDDSHYMYDDKAEVVVRIPREVDEFISSKSLTVVEDQAFIGSLYQRPELKVDRTPVVTIYNGKYLEFLSDELRHNFLEGKDVFAEVRKYFNE